MAIGTDEFTTLLENLRTGSDAAVKELLDRYGNHVLIAVRRRLNRELRAKFDSQDFTQAVWASFFENRQEISQFDSPQALIRYLQAIASHKVIEEFRRYCQTEQYGVQRERAIDSTVAAPQPTPSQNAMAHEHWERLQQDPASRYQQVLEWRREGVSYAEIARRFGVDESVVRRLLKRISERVD